MGTRNAEFAAKALTPAQQRQLDTLLGSVDGQCLKVNPDAPTTYVGPFPIEPAECKYAIARLYFESQRWTQAAHWFRRAAFEHAGHDAGIYAAQLYLEALNVLGTRPQPPRQSCYQVMRRDIEALACLYCREPDRRNREEPCHIFQRIRFDLEHKGSGDADPSTMPCSSDQRATSRGCEPLPPMLPKSCPPPTETP